MSEENLKSEPERLTLTPEELAKIEKRVKRAEKLAWLLDKGHLDPILGLFEGGGDAAAGLAACYIAFEAKRLGMPAKELAKMLGRTTLDTLIGSIPVVGDIFDAIYKSNLKNAKALRDHFEKIRAEAEESVEKQEEDLVCEDRAREQEDLKRAA